MVMAVPTTSSLPLPAGAPAETLGSMPSGTAADQLEQLRFLHEVARLATTARTWDELLETVVDRTRDVLHADVSSLYLLDRDGAYLTLAATNGLDRFQIGRARVPFGEGVTGPGRCGTPAADHPRRQGGQQVPVGPRHRPAPLRGIDAVGAAELARPDGRRPERPDGRGIERSPMPTSPSSARSPTSSPGSSKRAASRPRPRRGSSRSRRSTRREAS